MGVLSPSSPCFEPASINASLQRLTKMGLRYKLGANYGKTYSSYAGSDKARASDLVEFFADPEIKAILPVRGGAGAARILPLLDFSLIAKNPKILVGLSDITTLLLAVHQKAEMVTFHGPNLCIMYENAYTQSYYQKALFSCQPIGLITDPPSDEVWGASYPPTRMVIAPGKAHGLLTGGCLTIIRGLMGTPYEIETEGRILFLEDVNEEPHNIDRMLCQLLLAGKLQAAAGIIIGDCAGSRPGSSERRILSLNHSLEKVLQERLGNLGIPVVYGLKLGHTVGRITLPLGVCASLIAQESGVRLKIEEAACLD